MAKIPEKKSRDIDESCFTCATNQVINYDPKMHPQPRRNIMYLLYVLIAGFIFLFGVVFDAFAIQSIGFAVKLVQNIILFSILTGIFTIAGNIYLLAKGDKRACDRQILDVWSLSHFFFHTVVTLSFYYFIRDFWTSVLLSMALAFFWELFEHYVVDKKLLKYNFACESIVNKFSDLSLNFLGSIIGIFFI